MEVNMEYTVAELRGDILSKLFDLGIIPKFKENPALSSALVEIDRLIDTIPADKLGGNVRVKQVNQAITFTCADEDDNAYAFGITSYEPTSFKCFLLTQKSTISPEEEPIQQRSVVEKIISIEGNNYLNITTSGSTIDNYKCPIGKCNNSVWQENERYSAEGIMLKKEVVNYKRGEINEDFKTVSIDTMLYIPRKANLAVDENIENLRSKKTTISREYIDIARVFIQDKENKTMFCSSVPLKQENGLRNMEVEDLYLNAPSEVFIPPAEDWEIDLMITTESNPKVQEGLEHLASGRNKYSYDSTTDKLFERTGFDELPAPKVTI